MRRSWLTASSSADFTWSPRRSTSASLASSRSRARSTAPHSCADTDSSRRTSAGPKWLSRRAARITSPVSPCGARTGTRSSRRAGTDGVVAAGRPAWGCTTRTHRPPLGLSTSDAPPARAAVSASRSVPAPADALASSPPSSPLTTIRTASTPSSPRSRSATRPSAGSRFGSVISCATSDRRRASRALASASSARCSCPAATCPVTTAVSSSRISVTHSSGLATVREKRGSTRKKLDARKATNATVTAGPRPSATAASSTTIRYSIDALARWKRPSAAIRAVTTATPSRARPYRAGAGSRRAASMRLIVVRTPTRRACARVSRMGPGQK